MPVSIQQQPSGSRSVVALIPDVFVSLTVSNAIRGCAMNPVIVKAVSSLASAVEDPAVALVVVDVRAPADDDAWEQVAAVARSGVPVLAFGPHRDVERLRRARAAGVSRVVANSQFHREMAGLITRYARSIDGDERPQAPGDVGPTA